jgi:predicted nucleic acid-binding protein
VTIVDASAVVDLLLPPNVTRRDFLVSALPEPGVPWLAPDILPFEVFSVVRRHALRAVLSPALATSALRRLRALPLVYAPTASLLDAAWKLRDTFSAADALYAALAISAGEPLLTTDMRLARAAAAQAVAVQAPGD